MPPTGFFDFPRFVYVPKLYWQLLSPAKCSLLVNGQCDDGVLNEIKTILHVEMASFDSKYLGLPTPEGRMSATKFKTGKESLAKRMNSWSERYMSSGGK